MKISEIRIGNYVTDLGYIGPITAINNDKVVIKHKSGIDKVSIDEVQPIPLTEDWLIKFGFEKKDRRYSKEWFYLWDDDSNIVFALAEMEEETGLYLVIKYVHQLQNLYFALTNEELTITQ